MPFNRQHLYLGVLVILIDIINATQHHHQQHHQQHVLLENYNTNHNKCDDSYDDFLSDFSCFNFENKTKLPEFKKQKELKISPQLENLVENLIHAPTLREEGFCGKDTKFVLNSAKKLEQWALNMFDASSKLSDGIFNGNINNLGNYDECLNIENNEIKGQYCLVLMDFKVKNQSRVEEISLQTRYTDIIKFNIPGTIFSTYKSAICVPSSCSPKQIEQGIRRSLSYLNNIPEFDFVVKVDPQYCYTKDSIQIIYDIPTVLTIILFSTIVVLTIISTCFGNLIGNENKIKAIINSFSFGKNWCELFSYKTPIDDLKPLHGIRFINAVGLLVCHKALSVMFDPLVNRLDFVKEINRSWTILGRIAILYTDSFILMSGLLNAYLLLPYFQHTKGKINIKSLLLNRFLRITPNMLAVILFCTYIFQFIGDGPLWNEFVTPYTDMCKRNMWKNILYIHNLYGIQDMCLLFTHQIATDMQLFIISPLFVYLLYKWPKCGVTSLVSLAVISTVLRFIAAQKFNLTLMVYYGLSMQKIVDTANYSYYLPSHRITSYIIGILLGYYLRKKPEGLIVSKNTAGITWMILFLLAAIPWFTLHQGAHYGYKFEPFSMSIYSAIYPTFWCLVMAGWILLCYPNKGAWFGNFLRWKGFIVFTRIAYAFYLTQIPIMVYNVATKRHAGHATILKLLDIPEYICVLIASILLTLLIDIPFNNIKKIILFNKK